MEAWTSIIQEINDTSNEVLKQSATKIFNVYLQSHLTPPDGSRQPLGDEEEEIEDDEDNDRIKFKEQLQAIGMFGRIIPSHSLPVLFR